MSSYGGNQQVSISLFIMYFEKPIGERIGWHTMVTLLLKPFFVTRAFLLSFSLLLVMMLLGDLL